LKLKSLISNVYNLFRAGIMRRPEEGGSKKREHQDFEHAGAAVQNLSSSLDII
jgi:hypothetical protein